jgi:DNA-binding NarL/FixJ family response regulator
VDDHEVVRQGLAVLFRGEPDIDVIGEAASGEEALKVVKKLAPDVVLMDIRMSGMDGFKATAGIRKLNRDVAVIMLTGYESELYAAEAVRAGAAGYITKDCPRKLLINAIRVVTQGGTVWQGDPLRSGQPETTGSKEPLRVASVMPPVEAAKLPEKQLTTRELEVLTLLAKGYGNKQISSTLNLADVTVKKHITSIMFKLGVSNRTQAALSAVQLGLV